MRDSEDERSVKSARREGRGVDQADDPPMSSDNPEDFEADDDGDDEGENIKNIETVVNLSEREQCARNFAIRRAIEQRMEQKALDLDLDYLDCDLDD